MRHVATATLAALAVPAAALAVPAAAVRKHFPVIAVTAATTVVAAVGSRCSVRHPDGEQPQPSSRCVCGLRIDSNDVEQL